MQLLVSLSFFVVVMVALTALGYRRSRRPARLYRQLGRAAQAPELLAGAPQAPSRRTLAGLLGTLGKRLPGSTEDGGCLRRDLTMAGYRSDQALFVYNGARVVLAVVLFLLVAIFRDTITANPVLRMVLLVAGPLAGYSLPSFLLQRMITARQERLRLSLPDALDLTVISVEAGLGLDQALSNVSRELRITHRDLSEELGLVMLEMRAGKRRADALRNLADRTGEPEIRRLVAVLIQSDRFGTSMADALRTHSDFMRTHRRQEAEERAGKVGVKLVFPIFFFILPSMMIVAAGPGLLQVFKYLFPMMQGFSQ